MSDATIAGTARVPRVFLIGTIAAAGGVIGLMAAGVTGDVKVRRAIRMGFSFSERFIMTPVSK
jgi:hypothetical protein